MAKKPAYVAIADALRSQIESRELEPGDKLPPERELVDMYGVARMTVRHALDLLQLEGIIERKRGRTGGTFVRALPPIIDLTGKVSLTEQLIAHGLDVSSELISETAAPAPQIVVTAFGIDSRDKLLTSELVHFANGNPVFAETTYVRPGYESKYSRSSDDYARGQRTDLGGVTPHLRREDILFPANPTDKERESLSLAANTPVHRITRKLFEGDTLVMFASIVARTDAAQIRIVEEL